MFLQLDRIKKHLNIDDFYLDDDDYLLYLAEVAEMTVEKHIDNNLSSLANGRGELPSPLSHAILLFIGDMYQNRESISYSTPHEVPFSYGYLLDLYKNYNNTLN